MKKKIKLFAYCHRHSKELTHLTEERDMSACYDRAQEWDIEKEIEFPDEPRKPREYWLTGDAFDSFLEAHPNKDSAYAKFKEVEKIHVIEKLPDHVMVSKDDVKRILSAGGKFYTTQESIDYFCKEMGLGE